MSRRLEMEWAIEPRTDGVYVIERAVGLDKAMEFGPMPSTTIAESFIRARRQSFAERMARRGHLRQH